jgi:hypothetical protein
MTCQNCGSDDHETIACPALVADCEPEDMIIELDPETAALFKLGIPGSDWPEMGSVTLGG